MGPNTAPGRRSPSRSGPQAADESQAAARPGSSSGGRGSGPVVGVVHSVSSVTPRGVRRRARRVRGRRHHHRFTPARSRRADPQRAVARRGDHGVRGNAAEPGGDVQDIVDALERGRPSRRRREGRRPAKAQPVGRLVSIGRVSSVGRLRQRRPGRLRPTGVDDGLLRRPDTAPSCAPHSRAAEARRSTSRRCYPLPPVDQNQLGHDPSSTCVTMKTEAPPQRNHVPETLALQPCWTTSAQRLRVATQSQLRRTDDHATR